MESFKKVAADVRRLNPESPNYQHHQSQSPSHDFFHSAGTMNHHHLFREKSRKLDATDARLVDVIHTDGSQDFMDGFGLLKPIGHIDFFPNGGREQPGCTDIKNSVVVSHLKGELRVIKVRLSCLI